MTKTTSTQRMTKERSGFSLVLSLAVMAMILVMVISLTAFLTIELKSSETYLKRTLARNNAMLGARIALGQIQLLAGPDRRATGAALMLDTNPAEASPSLKNPQWIGIWNTNTQETGSDPAFYSGYHNGQNYMTDLRNRGGNYSRPEAMDWLVSHRKEDLQTNSNFGPNSESQTSWISLLGYKDAAGVDSEVKAPYVTVSQDNKETGGYAYWVSDESLKARIDVKDPYKKSAVTTPEGYYRLISPAVANITMIKSGGETGVYSSFDQDSVADRLQDLLSYGTASLLEFSSSTAAIKNKYLKQNFLDLSTSSSSLLVDTVNGGFLSDLTAFLHKQSPQIDDQAENNLLGLSSKDPIEKGTQYKEISPRYGSIRSWYDIRKNTTTLANSKDAGVKVIPPDQYEANTVNDGKVPLLIEQEKQPITPVMVEATWGFDFARVPPTDPLLTGKTAPFAFKTYIYPKVTLWNPYNVILRGQPYVVLMYGPELLDLQVKNYPSSQFGPADVFGISELGGKGALIFYLDAIDIPPGEVVVFTPSGQFAKFDPNAGNPLSAYAMPGNGFSFDNKVKFDTYTPEKAGADDISTDDYGFANGVNQCYGGYTGAILKIANTSAAGCTQTSVRTFPTLQRLNTNWGGEKRSYPNTFYWAMPGTSVGNNGSHPLYNASYHETARPHPPGAWQFGQRMIHVHDEEGDMAGYSAGSDTIPARVALQPPYISAFNVRSPTPMRNPLGYYFSWFNNTAGDLYIWHKTGVPLYGDPENAPILRGGGYYTGAPFGKNGYWTANTQKYVVFDLPYSDMALVSLGQFRNVMLSPFIWSPSHVLGSGQASIFSDPEKTVMLSKINSTGNTLWDSNESDARSDGSLYSTILNGKNGNKYVIHDASYVVNQEILNSYFLSGMLSKTETTSKWDGIKDLPNAKIRLNHMAANAQDELDKCKVDLNYMYHGSASILSNVGAFNVNSTSVESWKAYLSSIFGVPKMIGDGSVASRKVAAFSKLLVPQDSRGLVTNLISDTMWNGFRALEAADIEKLAIAIVNEVKLRGPFLSLSDFVNRRLIGTAPGGGAVTTYDFPEMALRGTLDAAIKKAGLNEFQYRMQGGNSQGNDSISKNEAPRHTVNFYVKAMPDFQSQSASGDLTQGEMLITMAPSMVVRGDTFTIRAYGDYKNAVTEQIESRAYIEMVVQRLPEYVDKSDDAKKPATMVVDRDLGRRSENMNLKASNRLLGRRFSIVSINWLTQDEL